jgi:hypothetical protein
VSTAAIGVAVTAMSAKPLAMSAAGSIDRRDEVRAFFVLPSILCASMVLCAFVTGQLAGISSTHLLLPYFSTSIAITIISTLLTIFWWVLRLARAQADTPLRIIRSRLKQRAPYLLLPAIVFPLFLASYTAVKTAIPFLAGYSWDPFWADADRLLFGQDAWRIAYSWLGTSAALPLEWFYTVAWGLTLMFILALVPLNAAPRFTTMFYSAMMATWLLGGVAFAYLFSAAGPVFAHLTNSNPHDQFADLRVFLGSSLPPSSPIRLTQTYLASALQSHVAVKGGGISAMPSMHLGVASTYVFAAKRTRWFAPAMLFWLTIFVASAYFGYHYWIDGIAAVLLAAVLWRVSEAIFSRNSAPTANLACGSAVADPALPN